MAAESLAAEDPNPKNNTNFLLKIVIIYDLKKKRNTHTTS